LAIGLAPPRGAIVFLKITRDEEIDALKTTGGLDDPDPNRLMLLFFFGLGGLAK